MMENLELELKLTVAHVNTVLKHLGAGVYAEVSELIQFIHGQATPQLQAASQAALSASAPATPAADAVPAADPAPAAEAPAAPTE
jgi:hypothetical protein